MSQPPNLHPLRSLTHPLWWSSALALLLNDHVLKGAGLAPHWLTGKLSDFVGLVVAPAVLAFLVRSRSRRGWLLCHVAIAAGFALINLIPEFARGVESLVAITPWTWSITVDPTDLIGLTVLPFSCLVLARAAERTALIPQWKYWFQRGGIAVGAFACMATSAPVTDCDTGCESFPNESAALMLGNDTAASRIVTVRALKPSVHLVCEAMLTDPGRFLSTAMFDSGEIWAIDPNRAVALQNRRFGECNAYLIEAEGLAPTILAWRDSEFPTTTLPTTVDARTATLVDDPVVGISLVHERAFRQRAPSLNGPECQTVPAEQALDWADARIATGQELTNIRMTPDGCYLLDFADDWTLVLCMPGTLPFAVGDLLDIGDVSVSGPLAEGLSISSTQYELQLVRGDDIPPGFAMVDSFGPGAPCGHEFDECGNAVVSAALSESSGEVTYRAGEQIEMLDGSSIRIVRVHWSLVNDLECAPLASNNRYLEYTRLQAFE